MFLYIHIKITLNKRKWGVLRVTVNNVKIEFAKWVQILDDAVCISVHSNALGKDIDPSILTPPN